MDGYDYTYDFAGNVQTKANVMDAALSELYTYNGLDELASAERGTLSFSGGQPTITPVTGALAMNQTWSLDGLGNWSSFTSGATTQTRTATAANEIASLSGGSGTPTYDLAGNMTGNGGPTYTYDAWDRLVGASIGRPRSNMNTTA